MNLFHFWKTLFCFAWLPLYFGGDSTSTTQQTTNNFDQRKVITNTLDGGAVAGAIGAAINTVNNMAGLAVQSIAGSNAAQVHAYDYADGIFHGALDYAQSNDTRALNAFDRAATIENDALSTVKSAYDKASAVQSGALGQLQGAYADAKGTTQAQQQIILAVLAVAGIFAFSAIQARG